MEKGSAETVIPDNPKRLHQDINLLQHLMNEHQQLKIENSRLKYEVDQLKIVLNSMENSRSYKFAQKLKKIYRSIQRLGFSNLEQSYIGDKDFEKGVHFWGKGVNLNSQVRECYGNHRSGWNYAISSLRKLHNGQAIFLDSFIEKTFTWDSASSEPYLYEWIGFIHVPPIVPEWFPDVLRAQHLDCIKKTDKWKKSEPYCRGFFTLSSHHAEYLRTMTDVPVSVLYHPTEIPELQWSIDSFEKNSSKKIVQVGWWLRNLYAIFELPESKYKKVFLKPKSEPWFEELMVAEREQRKKLGKLQGWMLDTATTISFLPNQQYDELLAENVVFINMYDTSANNAVIECIARGTPLLVNRLPAVIEYLGEDYPLYYDTYEEAIEKANTHQLLFETSEYLKKPGIRHKLSRRYFLESFLDSEVYKTINSRN